MIQAQILLLQLAIPESDVLRLNPFAPAQQVLDQAAQDCVTILNALKLGTYKSPNYPAATDPMAPYNLVLADKARDITLALNAAERSGNLTLAHSDLDQLNETHAAMGMGPVTGPKEIDILINVPGQTGAFADYIVNQVANGKTLFANLAEAEKVIAAAEAGSVPPPKPPVSFIVAGPSEPLQAPVGAITQDANGTLWQFFATPFGQVWYRVTKPFVSA